jgi:hypothetical protein
MKRRRAVRLTLGACMVILIAGCVAPFVRADGFKQQIRQGLQRALGRHVEIQGDVRLNLFTGPGFTAEQVIIADDPSAGFEPLARVTQLDLRVNPSFLWTGRLDFSRVRLVEPSVNVVKPDSGPWNLVALLQRKPGAPGRQAPRLPEIEVSAGRLNFKFGNTKSAFYLSNADVTISPRFSEPGAFHVRFYGEPSRTDRPARAFGAFRAEGRWISGAGAPGRLELDFELQPSAIDELATLIQGDAVGVHGVVTSRGKIWGPVSDLQVTGRLDVGDVHRWDLMPPHAGGWTLRYKGAADFASQRIEITALPSENPGAPVTARFLLVDLLSRPRWTADLSIDGLPAAAVLEVARHMGTPLPAGFGIHSGNVVGVIGYSSTAGLQGELSTEDAVVQWDTDSRLRLKHASVLVSGSEVSLQPSMFTGPGGETAHIEANYNLGSEALDASITGRGLSVSELRAGRGRLLKNASVGIMEQLSSGKWSGRLRLKRSEGIEGRWTGTVEVADASARIPGFAEPVRIVSASMSIDGDSVAVRRLHALAGDIEFFGTYRYAAREARPHRFDISVPAANVAQLEALLLPTLERESSFLTRTFRLRRRSLPDWLLSRCADGRLRIGALNAPDLSFRGIQTRIAWTGSTVQFESLTARAGEAAFNGTGSLTLTQAEPRYKLEGEFQNIDWRSGKVTIAGTLETIGTGSDFLMNLRSEGSFEARAVDVVPDMPLGTVSGAFGLTLSRSGPQLKLSSIQASAGAERFSGEGSTQSDGRLFMELANANRVLRVVVAR